MSKDANIRELLKTNDFDVVISSSGLKRLLDNTDLKEKWTIPIVVELIDVQRGIFYTFEHSSNNLIINMLAGKEMSKKKVVFIDKPFVKIQSDSLDLKYTSMKRLVKTNFCQYEAFK